MTRPITTAPTDTARAMHAAEMRGQNMQDAPERIWAVHHGWQVTLDGNVQIGQWKETAGPYGGIGYTRTDLCITEAECQRRIDAAVQAEREACAKTANRVTLIGNSPMQQHASLETACTIRDSIRARGQK